MTTWGEHVSPRFLRFVYSNEPVERLSELGGLRAALDQLVGGARVIPQRASRVRVEERVASTARPSAPPTCAVVLTRPADRFPDGQPRTSSQRRRKDPEDLTLAPRARICSPRRASEVTTVRDREPDPRQPSVRFRGRRHFAPARRRRPRWLTRGV